MNGRSPRKGAGAGAVMPDLRRLDAMHEQAGDVAAFLKALGNEQRLLILCNLLERPLAVGELNERVDLSQSALSQHLAVLRDAGFVECRRESQSILYSVKPGPVTQVMAVLQEVFCPPVRRPRGRAAPPASRRGTGGAS